MPGINIANAAGRDATVTIEGLQPRSTVRWLDKAGRQVSSVRVLKSSVSNDIEELQRQHGRLGEVAEALIAGDPEIDLENTGRFLTDTARVYLSEEQKLVHKIQFFDVIKNPDGSLRDRRPRKVLDQNVAAEVPLRWSEIFIPKVDAVRRFVFTGKVQLRHVNGLTYDFLHGMAKELEERNCLMVLGAGKSSNQPLVLRRGGSPYRGFLEGRTRGDSYRLVLHFSNVELKLPEPAEAEGDDQ